MPNSHLVCPSCGSKIKQYRNPFPTVDIIIKVEGGIVLVERNNAPLGWALPGGFVDYGETLEQAAVREAREETSLDIYNLKLFGCYSDPARDNRIHSISTVYIALAHGIPQAADDAKNVGVFKPERLPDRLCFDHGKILSDYASLHES